MSIMSHLLARTQTLLVGTLPTHSTQSGVHRASVSDYRVDVESLGVAPYLHIPPNPGSIGPSQTIERMCKVWAVIHKIVSKTDNMDTGCDAGGEMSMGVMQVGRYLRRPGE